MNPVKSTKAIKAAKPEKAVKPAKKAAKTTKVVETVTQQEFLRDTAATLGLTQQGLADRMNAPWTTLQKWLIHSGSENAREMPQIAWQLCREILEHERLKAKIEKMKAKLKG